MLIVAFGDSTGSTKCLQVIEAEENRDGNGDACPGRPRASPINKNVKAIFWLFK